MRKISAPKARVGPGDSPGRFHLKSYRPACSFGQARSPVANVSNAGGWDKRAPATALTQPARVSTLTLVKVNFKPETESRLQELAAKTGRAPDDLVEDALAGYLQELSQVREMLDSRYDDLKSGRVKPVDGEESFARLRRKSKSEDRRTSRS